MKPKKILAIWLCAAFSLYTSKALGQGFVPTAINWNIPSSLDDYNWQVYETYSTHSLADMNGDGLQDLIDAENEATTSTSDPFQTGSQKYWKVYFNTGSGFSASSTQWNIPGNMDSYTYQVYASYGTHYLYDMDGDGKADLVDGENEATTSVSDIFQTGNQQYWKVYLNTGSGFSATATQWNVPSDIDDSNYLAYHMYSFHAILDINGDGKPDLVDSENESIVSSNEVFQSGSQKYWRVYLNTGTGFSGTPTQWNIPSSLDDSNFQVYDTYSYHSLLDFDGDGKVDLVDGENQGTTSSADSWVSGSQHYWKVYLNTGSGFSASATQWNIPTDMDENDWSINEQYSRHSCIDMNGDGKPDLIDSENGGTTSTSDVFMAGSQRYWKVYYNTGNGFSASSTQWNIPSNMDDFDWKVYDTYSRHFVIDMNGDGTMDLINSENEGTTSVSDVFVSGNQKYWKVHLNSIASEISNWAISESPSFVAYPNPVEEALYVVFDPRFIGQDLIVFNTMGQVVFQTVISQEQMTMDFSNLTPGLYVAQIDGRNERSLKLIVE